VWPRAAGRELERGERLGPIELGDAISELLREELDVDSEREVQVDVE
jgi:hypothetical protein